MASRDEICDFVWQFQQRKKWIVYTYEEIVTINKAVKGKETSVTLPSKNLRKKFIIDLEKMVQRNETTLYEQKIRCLVSSSGFKVWLWKDDLDEWHSFKPYLSFYLEVAFQNNEKVFKFHDKSDFEVNFETWEQVNEETLLISSVKRENVEVVVTSELKQLCCKNWTLLKKVGSSDVQSAKRIKIDHTITSNDDTANKNGNIVSSDKKNTFNPMDFQEQMAPSNYIKDVPVDSECPERESYNIYCEGETVFSAMLNQTNMQNNNNKFYLIQLLEHKQKKLYSVWLRWGRVSYRGQTNHAKYGGSLSEAKAFFEEKFYAKTRNRWDDLKSFVHVKGKYDFLHMDLCPEQPKVVKLKIEVKSKLAPKLQSLLELICDQKRMEDIMKEMSYDCNRTPLGKLTLKQVQDGYIALNKISTILCAGVKGSELINACNDFYTKIPHNFGMKVPPIIRTQNEVDEKIKMLEALSNIAVAMGVLNSKSEKEEHHLDKYYRSLDCSLEILDPTDSEYLELKKCLKGTQGPTHTGYEMEILDAFKCFKPQEHSSFKDFQNNMLLWHGSRITNWLGILKEGLRIAPPEAPVTGYMFGKGVYFADVSSKSANYCFATKKKNEGLILMCEVSVGSQFPLMQADSDLPVGLPPDYNSVIGKGRINPSSFNTGVLSSEAKAPSGPLVENTAYQGSLHYNEYIVYDVKQIKMKYLMRVKFNFK